MILNDFPEFKMQCRQSKISPQRRIKGSRGKFPVVSGQESTEGLAPCHLPLNNKIGANVKISGRAHVTSVAPTCWLEIVFVFFFLRWNQQEKDKYVSTDSPSSTVL